MSKSDSTNTIDKKKRGHFTKRSLNFLDFPKDHPIATLIFTKSKWIHFIFKIPFLFISNLNLNKKII